MMVDNVEQRRATLKEANENWADMDSEELMQRSHSHDISHESGQILYHGKMMTY